MTARTHDTNGWFRVKRNPISRVGVFDYLGSSIGAPADQAGKVFKVYRPPEELGAREALDSFKTVPIIDDHEMLGAMDLGLTPVEQKGVGGVTGDAVEFDASSGIVYSNLTVFSEALAGQINRGKKQLSCGYRCEYDWTPGVTADGQQYDVVQRQIRGNHVAVVKRGRMGPDIAVLDHSFTYDSVDTQELQPVLDKETLDAIDAAVTKAVAGLDAAVTQAVADAMPAALAKAKEAEGEKEDEEEAEGGDKKAMDALADRVAALAARIDAAPKALDAAEVIRLTGDRDALAARLKPHVGVFDHAGMTHAEVVKYGLDKLEITNVADGAEAATLDGWLRARPASAAVTADAQDVKPSAVVTAYIAGKKD